MTNLRSKVVIRAANPADATRLEEVRRVAFAPVFASFRSILGEDIYNLAQAREDEAQAGYLTRFSQQARMGGICGRASWHRRWFRISSA